MHSLVKIYKNIFRKLSLSPKKASIFNFLSHKITQNRNFNIKHICREEGEVESPWGLGGILELRHINKIIT